MYPVFAGGAVYELTKAPPLSLAIADADSLKVRLESFQQEGDEDFSCPETSTSGAVAGPPFITPMEVGCHLLQRGCLCSFHILLCRILECSRLKQNHRKIPASRN